MAFKKGEGGRQRGSLNTLTKSVKERVLDTFNELQEDKDANLTSWAIDNTTEFYKIAAKLIPTEIKGNLEHKVINVIVADEK
jgi:hypothetical protein